MSDDENDSGVESEEEIPQEEKDQDLFEAAKRGDLPGCEEALKVGASPTHTGGDGWSPLLWSSCNGHLAIVELLLKDPHNAGDPYVAKGHGSAGGFGGTLNSGDAENVDENNDSVPIQNSPLHWASFKGHLEIVWALLKIGVSPYDTDSCGNTSLHLAATGGHLSVLQCLMSEGFDLSQRNVYGNTAYELADKANVRKLLKKATDEKGCYSSGKKFSAAVWRYYCTHSAHFYCDGETVRDQVVVTAGASRTKPVRYYTGSLKLIKNMETTLQNACKGTLTRDHLEPLSKAVKNARNNGCNVVWVHKGVRTLARLTAQCVMEDEMRIVNETRPISSKKQLKRLIKLMMSAKEEGVREEDGIEECESLLKATEAEVTLMGVSSLVEAIECATEANESEIKRLDDALKTALALGSQKELVENRTLLQKRLHAELNMNRYLASPAEEAVLVEGEPTEDVKYTMWDGTCFCAFHILFTFCVFVFFFSYFFFKQLTFIVVCCLSCLFCFFLCYTFPGSTVFNTATPGDKLKCLQFRHSGLTAAIAAATEIGTCHAPLVEQATEYESTLALDVTEEEESETARIEAEAKAAAKAAKKKKKKK